MTRTYPRLWRWSWSIFLQMESLTAVMLEFLSADFRTSFNLSKSWMPFRMALEMVTLRLRVVSYGT